MMQIVVGSMANIRLADVVTKDYFIIIEWTYGLRSGLFGGIHLKYCFSFPGFLSLEQLSANTLLQEVRDRGQTTAQVE